MKTALRLSNLPARQPLANFDFAFQPAIERSRIETLATCAWVRGTETVLIQGPPGIGETHLALGLGMEADFAAGENSVVVSPQGGTAEARRARRRLRRFRARPSAVERELHHIPARRPRPV